MRWGPFEGGPKARWRNVTQHAVGGAEDQNHPTRRAVWKSADGRNWQLVTDAPAWSARVWHTATVHDGRIWLIGGYDGRYLNDVWSSTDGVSWSANGAAGWSPRFALASAVFRDRVWVLGGKESGGRFTNDVWYLMK